MVEESCGVFLCCESKDQGPRSFCQIVQINAVLSELLQSVVKLKGLLLQSNAIYCTVSRGGNSDN